MLFVFNFLYMRKAAALFIYVKEFHPKIWEELGHPTSFRNNPPSCQMKLLHYLKDKKFEEAGDPEMIRLCRGMLRMLTLGAAGVAVIIAGIFAAVFNNATEHAG
jgi:hypothetical protein